MFAGLAQRPADGFPHVFTETFAKAYEAKLRTLVPPRRSAFGADRADPADPDDQAVGDCERDHVAVRLLIVEDDDIVADAIARGLAAANYSVHRVNSAEAAQAAIATEEFALAVIDVGLPGADGLTLVRRLRSAGKTMPTLILTARCTLNDKVKALDLGADDFLSKPFEPAELAARCRALMRRSSGALDGIIKLNRLSVDLAGQTAAHRRRRSGTDRARMAGARMPGAAHRPDGLQGARATGGRRVRTRTSRRTPSRCMSRRLRAKLGEAAVIRSLRGLGYRLEEAKSPRDLLDQPAVDFWLAVPLMLLALCGALVHYFNNVAPGVISSDRRLKEAANALMAHARRSRTVGLGRRQLPNAPPRCRPPIRSICGARPARAACSPATRGCRPSP